MTPRSPVTLSNENGLSRSQPYPVSRPAINGPQRPTHTPRRPHPPNAARQLSAGKH
jgi:hypothetical protein